MISIVFVGRNDNYGGDFEKRLFNTVTYNVNLLEGAKIAYELIFVEWNPVLLRRLLSKKIARRYPRARCYVVHRDVHRYICENRYIAVYEYYAKNIGAKYAYGDWLILMNPDDYLGAGIIELLARDDFDEQMLHRSGWINIKNEKDVENHSLEDNTKNDMPPYCNHSGDFVLCSRKLFETIGGYREDLAFTNCHKDSIFCLTAYELTRKACKIGNVYHVNHKRNNKRKRRLNFNLWKVPRIPQSKYGLSDVIIEEKLTDRVTRLCLKEPLRKQADKKILPRPFVPEAYVIENG